MNKVGLKYEILKLRCISLKNPLDKILKGERYRSMMKAHILYRPQFKLEVLKGVFETDYRRVNSGHKKRAPLGAL